MKENDVESWAICHLLCYSEQFQEKETTQGVSYSQKLNGCQLSTVKNISWKWRQSHRTTDDEHAVIAKLEVESVQFGAYLWICSVNTVKELINLINEKIQKKYFWFIW